MAIRFGVSSTVKNRLPRYSNFWDGTAVFSPFTATGSYDALASYTVPSGGVSQITFAGIPTGGQYQHLQIRIMARSNKTGTTNDYLNMNFNSDTGANYSLHQLLGDGTSASANSGTSQNSIFVSRIATADASASMFGGIVIDILDYANTSKYKTSRSLGGTDQNGSGRIYFNSGLWMNTAAISTIVIDAEGASSFAQHSQFALYGIRG